MDIDLSSYLKKNFWYERLRSMSEHLFGDRALLDEVQSGMPDIHTLGELLPYRWYDDKSKLYINNNSFGFIIETSPLIGADEKVVKSITSLIADILPPQCSVQFMNYPSPKVGNILNHWYAPRKATGGIFEEIARRRCEFMAGGVYKRLYKEEPFYLRHFRHFISVSLPGEPVDRLTARLEEVRRAYMPTLQGMGLATRTVEPKDFIQLIRELVWPEVDIYPRDAGYNPYQPLNEQISDSEAQLVVLANSLMLANDTQVLNFNVRRLPEYWAQWMNQKLIGDPEDVLRQFEGHFVQHLTVTTQDSTSASSKAAVKAVTTGNRVEDREYAKFFPNIVQKNRDWKFVRKHLGQGQRLNDCYYGLALYTRPDRQESAERHARDLYKSVNWELSKETFVQLQSFLGMLPFMPSEGLSVDMKRMKRTRTWVSFTAANLAPMQGEYSGNGSPGLLLIGRRGELVLWNPFANDEGNYNVACIGKSGSGKSVAMNEMVTGLRGTGVKVIILDDGESFKNNVLRLGGQHVKFNFNSGLCLNPFSLINVGEKEDLDYLKEGLGMVCKIFYQMARDGEKLDAFERAMIEQYVMAAWDAKGRQSCVQDVIDLLKEDPDQRAKDLSRMLGKYGRGGLYGDFFDGDCNVDLRGDLVCFELAELKEKKELQQIVIFLLMFLVSEAMYRGNRKLHISQVIDEAWDFLGGEYSSEIVGAFVRRCRKYRGNLITGTQSINDYYTSPGARAALENSDWKILLSQLPESIEAMRNDKKISMTEQLENDLKSLVMRDRMYSEMVIKGPRGYHIGRLVLDSYSAALYSSKGEDFALINDLLADGKTMDEAVAAVQKKFDDRRAAA